MPSVAIADRLFLTADREDTPQHVACLATFAIPDGAGGDWLADLALRLRAQTHVAAPFTYKLRNVALKAVAPAWTVLADDEIDLDYHFRHYSLPQPGGERELGVRVSEVHSTPLDPSRPLWEFHLIDGLENNRFAIYFKVHHALMDGVGGVRRISQMINPDQDARGVQALWTIGAKPSGAAATPIRTSVTATLNDGVKTFAALGKRAGRMVRDKRRGGDPDLGIPFAAPHSPLNGRITRHRRVATQSFEISRMKAVATAAGVKVNDVFLAVCAAGLRRYLSEISQLPVKTLTAGAPVNLRGAGDDSTNNAFSMMVVNLRTDLTDPVDRLQAIARSTVLGKAELGSMAKRATELYPALFMGPFILQNLIGTAGRGAPPYNVSISNVPGPMEQQYLDGARLEGMYPMGMLYHGVGLFIALFTTSGKLGLGFTGDRDSLPHLQRLALYTGEALTELEAALGLGANT